jgi:hypothetical protein
LVAACEVLGGEQYLRLVGLLHRDGASLHDRLHRNSACLYGGLPCRRPVASCIAGRRQLIVRLVAALALPLGPEANTLEAGTLTERALLILAGFVQLGTRSHQCDTCIARGVCEQTRSATDGKEVPTMNSQNAATQSL